MKNKLLLIPLLFSLTSYAQIFVKRSSEPQLFGKGIFNAKENLETIAIPQRVLKKHDSDDYLSGSLFGKLLTVNINPLTSGEWDVDKGDAVKRIKVLAGDASQLKIHFDMLKLSKNTEVYLYDPAGLVIAGPITSKENITKKDDLWGSTFFPGNSVIIEIRCPSEERLENIINIKHLFYGAEAFLHSNANDSLFTRPGPGYGLSNCGNNLACYGNSWALERRSVAQVTSVNSIASTAFLVMNTCNTNRPFLLTANHTLEYNGQPINTNTNTYEFLWISPTCNPTSNTTTTILFNGATVRANHPNTDFALLELNQSIPANSNLTFLGWSRSSTAPNGSVLISHPMGDIMKVSIDNHQATIGNVGVYTSTAWRVQWDAGGGEDGSSGGPLLNADNRAVGQLFGGSQVCNSQAPNTGQNFGRFDLSWIGGGTNTTRLSNWLDPTNSGAMTTNSTSSNSLTNFSFDNVSISGLAQFCTSSTYSIPNLPTGSSVSWSITTVTGQISHSTSNNVLTINRVTDADIIINATVNFCGYQSALGPLSVRVGGDAITLSSYSLGCDMVHLEVIGNTAPGANYTWSSSGNSMLFNGNTSTTTSTNYIEAYGISLDYPYVTTTNTCNQITGDGTVWNPFPRDLSNIYHEYLCSEHVSASVATTSYDTYYRWYINDVLVKEGGIGTSYYCTCDEPQNPTVSGYNTIRVDVESQCGNSSSGTFEFYRVCGYRMAVNLDIYPNPANNIVMIKITNEESTAKKLIGITKVRILDKFGVVKKVHRYKNLPSVVNIDVSTLPHDVYFIEVSDEKTSYKSKLSIQK